MKAKQKKVAKILIVIPTLHTCSVLVEYKKQKENEKPKHTSPKHSCEREKKDKTTKRKIETRRLFCSKIL